MKTLALVTAAVWPLMLSACLGSTTDGQTSVADVDADGVVADAGGDSGPAADAEPDAEPVPDAEPASDAEPDAEPDPGPDVDMPQGCCDEDGDCGEAEGCVLGRCLKAPPQGRCWTAEDCSLGECVGAGPCPCEAACEQWSEGPGYCVPEGKSCLVIPPADHPTMFGTCKKLLGWVFDGQGCVQAGGCDCFGLCDFVYASQEACEASCGIGPPPQPECCHLDAQCGAGKTCAKPLAQSALGICVDADKPPVCWDETECAQGEVCEGAMTCPCGSECKNLAPGKCAPQDGCCLEDAECGGGSVCRKPDGSGETYGRCMWELDEGMCWSSDDCGGGQACVDAFYCPCYQLCGAPDIPGTCQDLPGGCCVDDAGCPEGQQCEANGPSLPGTCKADPDGPECPFDAQCCWTKDDCGKGQLCQGASVCGCLALCPTCGDCLPDQIGQCVGADGACCNGDSDCPEGWLCAGQEGGGPGSCKPPPPFGKCWSPAQCTLGEACIKAQLCPCNAECDQEDAPGDCWLE